MATQVHDGPSLPYDAAGSGPPVLMLHGLLNTRQIWSPVAERLSSRFATVRCDLHGQARPVGSDRFSPPVRLLDLLDRLELPAVHVVSQGASWVVGASLAVGAPHRVLSLSVVDPVVPRPEQSPVFQESWHSEMLLQWLSVAHGSVVRQPEHAAAIRAAVAQQTHVCMPAPEDISTLPAIMGCDIPRLSRVACPVLALVGEGAPQESKALVASTFAQVRHVRIMPIPGANRHSPLEAPDYVSKLLENFLSPISTPG